MQNTTSSAIEYPPTARALFNQAFKVGTALGRKFEATDMTVSLRQAAMEYATWYTGDFEYMVDMHSRVTRGGWFMSDLQCKAVLNCLMAEARRRIAAKPRDTRTQEQQDFAKHLHGYVGGAPEAAPVAPAVTIPLGTFTVVFPDGYQTIRLQAARDKSDSRIFAKYLSGQSNETDFQYFATIFPGGRVSNGGGFERQRLALKVVMGAAPSELGEMGLAYAMASSNCFNCGRKLTVPASIHSGLGPDCADKMGAFYGEPPTPEAPVTKLDHAAEFCTGDCPHHVADTSTGVEESEDELLDMVAATAPSAVKHDAYAEGDRINRETNARIQAIKASGRKPTYEDIFGED